MSGHEVRHIGAAPCGWVRSLDERKIMGSVDVIARDWS